MKHIVIFCFALIGFSSYSQTIDLSKREDELLYLLDELRNSTTDADKTKNNQAFKTKLADVLLQKETFDHPFSTLTSVGFIDSPDGMVRIINWNVEQDDKSQRYFGFVQHFDKRKKKLTVTELKEDVFGLAQPEEIIEAGKWYGALYYKIIPVKKGSKTIYTVLGWDGNNTMSNIKLIDAMYVNGRTIKFGASIFKIGDETKKRLFYEHSEKVTMTLRYEDDRERIMMDHLSPESPSMKGYRSFYVPDLSYDALKFEKSKWVLHEDVIGINAHEDSEKREIYTKDPKTGKLKKTTIKNEWMDPSDASAPAGGNEHVAVTPDEKGTTTKSKENSEEKKNGPKVNKRDKRDPSNLSMYDDLKKKKKRRKKKKKN